MRARSRALAILSRVSATDRFKKGLIERLYVLAAKSYPRNCKPVRSRERV